MTYSRFQSHFERDAFPNSAVTGAGDSLLISASGIDELFLRFGGLSFNDGLYRIMSLSIQELANEFISTAFPTQANSAKAFGYDWLGRIFALDASRAIDGSPAVMMFEPGTGKSLKIPRALVAFHNYELIDHADAALASRFHQEWLASGGKAPSLDQCAGYKKPLFLGGKDSIQNLDLVDIDVYWTISGQLLAGLQGGHIPNGSR